MADSNITASGLAAAAGTGAVSLQWAVTNPNEGGLQYLDLALVEVWASASNNRSLGSKVGEAAKGQNTFVHTLAGGTLRYYWVRPKNTSGYYGDWHPASASAGVSGTAGEVTSIDNGTITDSVIEASTFRSVSCDWAGGGIASTLGDLTLFSRALHGGQLVSGESLAFMSPLPRELGKHIEKLDKEKDATL